MAFLTCLSVPSFEIGLIPIPQASSNLIFFTPISLVRNSINFEASSELASNSILTKMKIPLDEKRQKYEDKKK